MSTTQYDQTVKEAYTHGLEEIYAIEEVDVRSIRTIAPKENKPSPRKKLAREHNVQLNLDLGGDYTPAMASFILMEPIQQLELSKHLEACLLSRSVNTIGALRSAPLEDLPLGHGQEIAEKLETYIHGRQIDLADCIDYGAWIRGLLGAAAPIRSYLFLQQWGLQDWIKLDAHEKQDLRRVTEERRQLLLQEQMEELINKSPLFVQSMRQVTNTFIRPWLRKRGGLANKLELAERMEGIAYEPSTAAITLLSQVYCGGSFILEKFLYHADLQLFCSEPAIAEAYDAVVDRARTYFYNDAVFYPLEQLEQLVCRELAQEWQGYPETFVRQALRMSPMFYVAKGSDHKLQIRLK